MGVPLLLVASAIGLVLLCLVLAMLARGRREARRDLAAAQAETEQLRARLEALEERAATRERDFTTLTRAIGGEDASYLITDAGVERAEPNVPDRVVLSATFGEPLVKMVALGHGVARALSPESRNRIWFEMRREVRRARKQRRRDMKQAYRQMRDEERNAA